MKKGMMAFLALCMIFVSGCTTSYHYYTRSFYDYFDTVTSYMTYATSEAAFDQQCKLVEKKLAYYDALFDQYHSHSHINNVKTVNDAAGKKAVKVDRALIDCVSLSISRSRHISSQVNIAMGSVLSIWHSYRTKAEKNNNEGSVPSYKELKKASQHCDLSSISIDKKASTLYISDDETSLDLGATAKGYAIEKIKQALINAHVDNFLISGGGNVVSHGVRKLRKSGDFYLSACEKKYCVGIASPQDGNYASTGADSTNEAVLIADGSSIVTSGDYQRYYKDKNGVRYSHLIDPKTLYPATYFRSVSIITKDSSLADFLSTALFLMPYSKGRKLIESLKGVEAIWLLTSGKIRYSSGLHDNKNLYIINKDRLK